MSESVKGPPRSDSFSRNDEWHDFNAVEPQFRGKGIPQAPSDPRMIRYNRF
jgi:hypothetical protein